MHTIRKTIFFPVLIFVFTLAFLSFALETSASFAKSKATENQENAASLLDFKSNSNPNLTNSEPFSFLIEDLELLFSKQVNYSSDTSINLFSPRQEAPQSSNSNVSADAFAQTGIFTIIDAPGSTFTKAYSINDAGDVAGYYSDGSRDHGFKFSNGNYTIIDPPGSLGTVIKSINNAGDVAGWYFDSDRVMRSFKFSNGNYTIIDPPISNPRGNYATAINDGGDVVGGSSGEIIYQNYAADTHKGYKLSNGNYTFFDQRLPPPPVPQSTTSWATAINDAGDVVGYDCSCYSSTLARTAFKFSNGNYTIIDPPGSTNKWAFSINNAGDVAGYYFDSNNRGHGYKFSNGNYTIIDPPGSTHTGVTWLGQGDGAISINNAGDVAGRYQDSTGKTRGFKFSNGNYTIIDVPGSTYTEAYSINDAGDVAGRYQDSTGKTRGFKWIDGGPDLKVVKVEPVQVIYRDEYLRNGSPGDTPIKLVADKPTALRVTVSINKKISELPTGLTEVPIRVSYGTQSIDRSIPTSQFKDNGSESIAVEIFNKPFIPSGNGSFVVDVDPANLVAEANKANNKFTLNVETEIRKVSMQYVSILSPFYQPPNSINSTATISDSFISATFPIAPLLPGGVSPDAVSGSPDFTRSTPTSPWTKGIIEDSATLARMAEKKGLDRIFGVVSKDYFIKHGEIGTVGARIHRKSGIIVEIAGDDSATDGSTAAHELGHMYYIPGGLLEEYTTNPPGKPAASGFWVNRGISVSGDASSPDFRYCLMGNAPTDKSWIDKEHYDHLLNAIKPVSTVSNTFSATKTKNSVSSTQQAQNFSENFLVVSAIVGKDGSIKPLAWNTTSLGSPTESEQGGNFTVKVLNAAGQTVSELLVPVEFVINLEPKGAFPTDIAPLVVKVPYPVNAASVQILKDNQLIKTIAITGKLLRDTINAIPDSGFNGNAVQQRSDLLGKVDVFESKLASGNKEEARQLLVNDLKPNVQQMLIDSYIVETALQLTKPEVLSVIDGEINRLTGTTAATVSVSGRVTSRGRGISNAVVHLTNQSGEIQTAKTNRLGYYTFTNLAAGETYIFNVFSKRYQFNPKVVSLTEDLDELNFTAQ
jgi:hypothetical protein